MKWCSNDVDYRSPSAEDPGQSENTYFGQNVQPLFCSTRVACSRNARQSIQTLSLSRAPHYTLSSSPYPLLMVQRPRANVNEYLVMLWVSPCVDSKGVVDRRAYMFPI